mmetsp:Transcript_12027/g.27887  ORF Transcript_12027/g.27887 Transcript_12027/m.27887 type:complete len:208 (-) Transcript_12027:319-942(-)
MSCRVRPPSTVRPRPHSTEGAAAQPLGCPQWKVASIHWRCARLAMSSWRCRVSSTDMLSMRAPRWAQSFFWRWTRRRIPAGPAAPPPTSLERGWTHFTPGRRSLTAMVYPRACVVRFARLRRSQCRKCRLACDHSSLCQPPQQPPPLKTSWGRPKWWSARSSRCAPRRTAHNLWVRLSRCTPRQTNNRTRRLPLPFWRKLIIRVGKA